MLRPTALSNVQSAPICLATEAATTIATQAEAPTATADGGEAASFVPKVFPPLPSLSHHLVDFLLIILASLLDLLVEIKHLVSRLEGGKNL